MQHKDWYCWEDSIKHQDHVSSVSMIIPVACSFYIKVHVLMSHFTNFQNNANKGFLTQYIFYCNKCPPIDSEINQNKRKENVIR